MTTRRDGERGLSIIEAIVIATITALLALLIMPLLPRASAGSLAVAERGVDALDQMRAEREFRTLLRGVSMREINGEPQSVVVGSVAQVTIRPTLQSSESCARAGAPIVRLAVEGNALVCISDGRRRVVVRWQRDSAGVLSYSADGASWSPNWNEPSVAPYVRFEIRQRGQVQLTWVERIIGEPT